MLSSSALPRSDLPDSRGKRDGRVALGFWSRVDSPDDLGVAGLTSPTSMKGTSSHITGLWSI